MKTTTLFISLPFLVVRMATGAPAGVESFDTDPGWESFRSRLMPDPPPVVEQHFGYRGKSRLAGGMKEGEIGGWVRRSMNPATYAKVIPTRGLEEKLTASGTFAVTKNGGGSGALFGWFSEKSRGWRAANSLAFRIDGNGGNYWVLFEYGTRHWLTGGGATFEGRYQTTKTKPFAADGTPHRWSLTYDPAAEGGNGAITFTLDGKDYRQPLAAGHKADGAVFDRFGMFNQQTTGGGMEVYFDDLALEGQTMDFSGDPKWEARGNDGEFPERAVRPLQNFGFSDTAFAGGGKGEMGGIVWRDEKPAYYAARTAPLTLQDELTASGRLAFTVAGSDSGVYLGWFDSRAKQNKATPEHVENQKNLLAINIEGPSRVGHYFRPAYRVASGEGEVKATGPVIHPDGKAHLWRLYYSPAGAGGKGRITLTFDDITQTLDLKPGLKESGARFDRFGLFNTQTGGWHTELYIDDLTFTGAAGIQ